MLLQREINRGSSTAVYSASRVASEERSAEDDRLVVKAFGWRAMRSMAVELRTLRTIGTHPHMPELVKYSTDPRTYTGFLVMRPLGECDLLSLLCEAYENKDRRPRAVRVLCDGLQGLLHLHENGLVHRDFKPDNVVACFARDGGRGLLVDFNLTCCEGKVCSAAGTVQYAAPEILQAMRQRCRVCVLGNQDAFNLGRTLLVVLKARCLPKSLVHSLGEGLMHEAPSKRLTVRRALRALDAFV
jgi:serine/threonine protein kinase